MGGGKNLPSISWHVSYNTWSRFVQQKQVRDSVRAQMEHYKLDGHGMTSHARLVAW